jgi:hypothetical protein
MLLRFFIVISKIFFSFDPRNVGVPSKFFLVSYWSAGVDRLFATPSLVSLWLKGTVPRDFRLQVRSCISIPQAPEYPIRTVSNFFDTGSLNPQGSIRKGVRVI